MDEARKKLLRIDTNFKGVLIGGKVISQILY
jgi:hypothetical protein